MIHPSALLRVARALPLLAAVFAISFGGAHPQDAFAQVEAQTVGCAPDAIVCRVSVASDSTQANDHSYYRYWPAVSADGLFIAFNSVATNLVPGDTNGQADVFVHDR